MQRMIDFSSKKMCFHFYPSNYSKHYPSNVSHLAPIQNRCKYRRISIRTTKVYYKANFEISGNLGFSARLFASSFKKKSGTKVECSRISSISLDAHSLVLCKWEIFQFISFSSTFPEFFKLWWFLAKLLSRFFFESHPSQLRQSWINLNKISQITIVKCLDYKKNELVGPIPRCFCVNFSNNLRVLSQKLIDQNSK